MSVVRNTPTPQGRELGSHLARFCADVHDRCKSCAFRGGTAPNGCPTTVMDALKCVMEHVPFTCHEDKSDDPRLCAGYAAMVDTTTPPVIADWPFSDEVQPSVDDEPRRAGASASGAKRPQREREPHGRKQRKRGRVMAESKSMKLTIDDGGVCLTATMLIRILKAHLKMMRAFGADDIEIPSLHYDFEPAPPATEGKS